MGALPVVSVVVRTTGRRQAFLRTALRCVERQTWPLLEVVIVRDGGFPEDFEAWASEIASWEPHPREGRPDVEVRLANFQGEGNRSRAANAGIRLATGDYVAFLDDDDTIHPWHLERLVAHLETPEAARARTELAELRAIRLRLEDTFGASAGEKHEDALAELEQVSDRVNELEARLLSGPCVAYSDAREVLCDRENGELADAKGRIFEHPFTHEELLRSKLRPNNALLVRALVLRSVKFDEDLPICEDYDFLLNLSRRVHFVHVPGIGAEWRVRNDGSNVGSNREDVALFTRRVQARYGGG